MSLHRELSRLYVIVTVWKLGVVWGKNIHATKVHKNVSSLIFFFFFVTLFIQAIHVQPATADLPQAPAHLITNTFAHVNPIQ